jgi:two-component system, OmpR family, response regulator
MHILFVEDDPAIADSVSRALKLQGHAVDWTNKGEPVAKTLEQDPYDLLILDIGLPGIDGFEVLRRLRSRHNAIPVLILTARDAVDDRVHGLELGADDYLVKPFALPELLARVHALARRKQAKIDMKLIHGPLILDTDSRRASLGQASLEISSREWGLLEFLMNRVEKVVSKQQIAQAIGGWAEELSDNAIEVCVSRLRAKLEPAGIKIRTIRGFGYMLEEFSNVA